MGPGGQDGHRDRRRFPPLDALRRRTSAKWALCTRATCCRSGSPRWTWPRRAACPQLLQRAVADGDTGYAAPALLAPAFAGFAARRWGWTVDPARCFPVADVMTGVAEVLQALTAPGDAVVVCPPVYHPFFARPVEAGRTVVEVPLRGDGSLDLPGIAAALDAGARAVLLASPAQPDRPGLVAAPSWPPSTRSAPRTGPWWSPTRSTRR